MHSCATESQFHWNISTMTSLVGALDAVVASVFAFVVVVVEPCCLMLIRCVEPRPEGSAQTGARAATAAVSTARRDQEGMLRVLKSVEGKEWGCPRWVESLKAESGCETGRSWWPPWRSRPRDLKRQLGQAPMWKTPSRRGSRIGEMD